MMTELIEGLYTEGEKIADTKAPHDVPIAKRWEQRKFNAKLVNPANRRKLDIIVVGYGLDYAERYRNLPFIGTLRPEVYGG